jgi:hypothetical protein
VEERRRRWDLGGRDPNARVVSLEEAIEQLFADDTLLRPGDGAEEGSFDPHAAGK